SPFAPPPTWRLMEATHARRLPPALLPSSRLAAVPLPEGRLECLRRRQIRPAPRTDRPREDARGMARTGGRFSLRSGGRHPPSVILPRPLAHPAPGARPGHPPRPAGTTGDPRPETGGRSPHRRHLVLGPRPLEEAAALRPGHHARESV